MKGPAAKATALPQFVRRGSVLSTPKVASPQELGRRGSVALAKRRSNFSSEDSEARSPGLRTGNNIKVVVRFRPLNEIEKTVTEETNFCQFDDRIVSIAVGKEVETYTFDRVFPPGSSQKEVFDFVGKSIIEDVITGYNGTVLAYGQTGTGKTYTMMGNDFFSDDLRGIIPRAASQIFETVSSSDSETEYIFKCSMLEIYKETLRDLLNPESTSLRIKECPAKGIYVQGLTEVCVTSEEEMLELISLGEQMRTVAMTRLNPFSSRSHQLFVMEARQKSNDGCEKRGVLNLVDLAGSEKVNFSGVKGNSLEETKKINLSLSALGNVIHALTSGSDHVPYRDSKLTRLLEESLGGNYKTTLIVACSPSLKNSEETLNTLNFAVRAKSIKNKAHVNIKSSPDDLEKAIKQLKSELMNAHREIQLLKSVRVESSVSTEYKSIMTSPSLSSLAVIKLRNGSTGECADDRMSGHDEEVSPKPSSPYEPDSLNSSLVGVNSLEAKAEFDKIRLVKSTFKAKLQLKSQQIQALSEEIEFLQAGKADLETKLLRARAKQLAAERRAHEYFESYHKTLGCINKDAAENAILKQQVASLQLQVERLAACLQDMEFRFGVSISSLQTSGDLTSVEFEDQSQVFMCEDEEDPSASSSLPNLSYTTKHLPIDTETLFDRDSYAFHVKNSLKEPSNREILVYTLRNQLTAASLLNCNMALALRAFKWRNWILQEKYSLRKASCKHQASQASYLQEMVERLHDSFNAIVKLQERVPETEQSRVVRTAENSSKRKLVLKSCNSKAVRRPSGRVNQFPSYVTIDSRERSMNGDNSYKLSSFIDSSSHELQPLKVRTLETNFNLQLSYNQSLKASLERSKAEASSYKELLGSLEKKVYEAHKSERGRWVSFIAEIKANCENELINKHDELMRVVSQVSMWTAKYSIGIERPALEDLRTILKNSQLSKPPAQAMLKIDELVSLSPAGSLPREVGSTRVDWQRGDTSLSVDLEP